MDKLRQTINNIIFEQKDWEKKAGFRSKPNQQRLVDFDHLDSVIKDIFSAIPALHKNIEIADKDPNIFIIRLSIAYEILAYDLYVQYVSSKRYSSAEEQDRDVFYGLLRKQNIYSMIAVYKLMHDCPFQAMQLTRGYIESSHILYLSKIDTMWFDKYFKGEVKPEDAVSNWMKNNKPSIVKRKIKSIHNEWKKEDEEQGVTHFGVRSIDADYITDETVKIIYDSTSDFVHFRKDSIFFTSYDRNDKRFSASIIQASTHEAQLEIESDIARIFQRLSGILSMLDLNLLRRISGFKLAHDLNTVLIHLWDIDSNIDADHTDDTTRDSQTVSK